MARPSARVPYPPRIFKPKLDALLRQRNLDVRSLAAIAQVSPPTAASIIAGSDLRLSTARRIAANLQVTVEEIWPYS